jgi:heme oxygenase (mycobilin-producing)
MAVKIVISRHYSKDNLTILSSLLSQLATLAEEHEGYISGEYLQSDDDEEHHLIISTWNSLEDWKEFSRLEQVKRLHLLIDTYLGVTTSHSLYVTENFESAANTNVTENIKLEALASS